MNGIIYQSYTETHQQREQHTHTHNTTASELHIMTCYINYQALY